MADKYKHVKDGGSFTGEGFDHDSKVVFSTTTTWKNTTKETPEQIAARETRLKKLQANGEALQNVMGGSLGTWKSIDPGNTWQTNPQKTIESLMNINVGDTIMTMDIENVGTAPHMRIAGSVDYSAITELAIIKSQLTQVGGQYKLQENAAASILLKPNTKAFRAMRTLIETMESAPKPWQVELNKDQRRTLNDLILYSDPSNFRKHSNGYTELVKQNRGAQVPEGFMFNQDHVKQMRQGLFNLGLHGTSRAKARQTILQMFGSQKNVTVGGFNTQNYDNPFFLHWLDNEIIPSTQDKRERQELQRLRGLIANANDLDNRQLINVLAKDPASRLGGLLDLTQQGIGQQLSKMGHQIDIGVAHTGIDDTRTSNRMTEIFLNEFGLFDMVKKQGSGKTSRNVAMWDTTPWKAGDKLFSIAGMGFNQAGANDAIYAEVEDPKTKKKKWTLTSDDKVAPIYTNNEYLIEKEFNGVLLDPDGKPQYGYALRNIDTGNIHVITRESKSEIQNIMQQSMLSLDDVKNADELKGQKAFDHARRTYLRAFGSDSDRSGRNLLNRLMTGVEALDAGRAQNLEGDALEKFVRNYDSPNNKNRTTKATFKDSLTGNWVKGEATESFYKDLTLMEGRLRAEGKYIQDFLDALDANIPPIAKGDGVSYPKAHDIALNHFKKELDRRFGRNTSEMQQAGFDILLGKEKEKQSIKLGSVKQTRSSINSILKHGTMKDRSHPAHVQKQRLLQIVNRAQAHNAISPKDAKEYRDLLKEVKSDSRMSYAVNELANYLNNRFKFDASITGLGATFDTLDIEDPTQVTRKSALEDPTQGYFAQKSEIHNRSIEHAKTIMNSPWNKGSGGLDITNSSIISRLDEHDEAMKSIWKQAGGEGSQVGRSDSKKALNKLINSFRKDGFEVALVEDARKNGLVLAFAPHEVAQRVFNLNEGAAILNSDEVMKFAIPLLNQNKDIVLPGQSRVGRPKIFSTGNGEYMGTAFDEAIRNISRLAPTARKMYQKGDIIEGTSMLQGNIRRSVQQLSMNSKYMKDSDLDRNDTRTSKAARYVRGQVIDVTEFAQAWYKDTYKNKSITSKEVQMKEQYKTFFQTLDRDEATAFHKSIDAWVLENRGLVVNGHGVKDTHYANGLRSINSVQSLQPMGYLNPTARENIPKTVNYLPLDRAETEETLRARGISESKIDRMLNRRYTTDEAIKELGSEVNWVNMRAAYMEDSQLARLMEDGGVDPKRAALYSTYEGQAVIADDMVEIMTAKRTKKFKLAQGEALDTSITKFFQEAVKKGLAEVDRDGNIMFKAEADMKERQITNVLQRATGEEHIGTAHYNKFKLTAGKLAGDSSYMESLHDNVYFTGLKVDEYGMPQEVEFETRQLAQSSMKGGTASGQRITFKIAERAHLEAAGIDADIVLPKANPARNLHGAFVQNKVDLYVDEMIKQIDDGVITPGGLTKDQLINRELNSIVGTMKGRFNIKDEDLSVKNGAIVMNHLFGRKVEEVDGVKRIIPDKSTTINLSTLEGFMSDMDKRYNTNFLGNTIEYGVEGVSLADVYTWHNSMGVVKDNSSGLVRIGYKEADMVAQRADRILGEGNAVTGWFRNHLEIAAQAQSGYKDTKDPVTGKVISGRDRFMDGINKAILDVTDEELRKGNVVGSNEIIISTQGTSFNDNDREGRRIIRVNENGVPEVSAHAFEDVRKLTSSRDMLTVQDLNRTILNMGNVMDDMNMVGPAGAEVNAGLKKIFQENGGTALFQLPTNEFSRKYVRMIDTDVAAVGVGKEAMPVMDNLQKAQMSIWRLTKQYQEDKTDETRVKLQGAIDEYEQNVTKVWSSVRDGSAADLHSARLDMSGRFQIQGLNTSQSAHFEEGTVYIGRERAREMIRGAEDDIAKAIGGGINFSDIDSTLSAEEQRLAKQNKVLDYMTSDGLYSGINRYPTIAEDAVQILKLKVDGSLDEIGPDGNPLSAKGGYVTVGTAVRLKADYDGDFFSSFLTHYKSTKDNTGYEAADIHRSMKTIHEHDVEKLNLVGNYVKADLESKAQERGVTVQELWRDAEFRQSFHQEWEAKVGPLYDQETQRSRMGKSNVGILDNLRYKLSNVASATYHILEEEGHIDRDERFRKTKISQDFGRLFSQEAISSKKYTIDGLRSSITEQMEKANMAVPQGEEMNRLISEQMSEQDRYIQMLQEGIYRPDAEGRKKIVTAAQGLGIFTDDLDKKGLVEGVTGEEGGPRFIDPKATGKWDYTPNQMLDVLQETYNLNPDEWLHGKFLKMAVSEGVPDIETASKMARGYEGTVFPTPGVEGALPTEGVFNETYDRGVERYRRSVISNMENMNRSGDAIEDTIVRGPATQADGMLSNLTVGQRAGARFTTFMDGFSGMTSGLSGGTGAMVGAGMFGAMWAASALVRSGPTPEGLQEQIQQPQAVNPLSGQAPTARVTQNNGENINIRISAKNAKNMSEQDVSALVHQELAAMTSMQMNVNMNVNDNTQNIDQQWLQGVVANAINKGFGF